MNVDLTKLAKELREGSADVKVFPTHLQWYPRTNRRASCMVDADGTFRWWGKVDFSITDIIRRHLAGGDAARTEAGG